MSLQKIHPAVPNLLRGKNIVSRGKDIERFYFT
jgi:hypothetical protein